MLFNSLQFLIFFPLVTAGYFALPHRFRWSWLLAASCLFYMAFVPAYVLILAGTIVVDYLAGRLIEAAPSSHKRFFLALSLASNLGVLAFFKYANFFSDNFNILLRAVGGARALPVLHVVLPIGLSFHTFQAMSYTIEVYRGRQQAERHFGIFALYVMFYPQLVAGPIERPQHILPQLHAEHRFVYDDVVAGLKLMAWGFFQKVFVADRIAQIVNPVFDHPGEFHGLLLAIAAVGFTFQIYFDFAAYSEIAVGAAQVMGIRLMTNFRRPFFATSVSEFWARWHISLTSWFRDYLYIPLGGNRVPKGRWYANLMIVFVLSGLWHGAAWTYVFWGALNGAYLICALALVPIRPRAAPSSIAARLWKIACVFALECVAFVFFRARTIGDAFHLLGHIPDGLFADLAALAHRDLHAVFGAHTELPQGREWILAVFGVAVVFLVHLAEERGSSGSWLSSSPSWVRWPVYAGLVYLPLAYPAGEPVRFIYFQF